MSSDSDKAVAGENIKDDSTLEQSMISSPGEGKDDLTSGTSAGNLAEEMQQMELASPILDLELGSNGKGARKKTPFWGSSSEKFQESGEQGNPTLVDRKVTSQVSHFSPIKAIFKYIPWLNTYLCHYVAFRPSTAEIHGLTCIDDKVVRTRCIDYLEKEGFKIWSYIPDSFVLRHNEQVSYQYRCISPEGSRFEPDAEILTRKDVLPQKRNAFILLPPPEQHIDVVRIKCTRTTSNETSTSVLILEWRTPEAHAANYTITGGEFPAASFGPVTHRHEVSLIDQQFVTEIHHHHYGSDNKIGSAPGNGDNDITRQESSHDSEEEQMSNSEAEQTASARTEMLMEQNEDAAARSIKSSSEEDYFSAENEECQEQSRLQTAPPSSGEEDEPNDMQGDTDSSDEEAQQATPSSSIERPIECADATLGSSQTSTGSVMQEDNFAEPELMLQDQDLPALIEETTKEEATAALQALPPGAHSHQDSDPRMEAVEQTVGKLAERMGNIERIVSHENATGSNIDQEFDADQSNAVILGAISNQVGTLTSQFSVLTSEVRTISKDVKDIKENVSETEKNDKLILPSGITVSTDEDNLIYKAKDSGVVIYEGERMGVGVTHKLAVKFLPSSDIAESEAKSLERIRFHPNVVGIHCTGIFPTNSERGDDIYIAMDRCSRKTLHEYVTECDNFDPHLALNHSTQIISGLKYIHERKVAHRDLKPQNVLFIDDDTYDEIKISDFGMSKTYQSDQTKSVKSGAFGTQCYVAPEVVRSENVEDVYKCDIFSLGILVAFRLSNGEHPYGKTHWEQTANIATDKKPDLSKVGLPCERQKNAAVEIINKMLHKEWQSRPIADDVLKDWTKYVVESPDSVLKIFEEIDENISVPLSKAEYLDPGKECEVKIVGCRVTIQKTSFKQTPIVYVAVRSTPISGHIQSGQFAISPEVECEIFNSTCKRQVIICLPLHALPSDNSKNVRVRGKVDGKWKDLKVSSMKDRRVEIQVSVRKCIEVFVTCSRIQKVFIRHFLFCKDRLQLCSVVSIDNEALITRFNDALVKNGIAMPDELPSISDLQEKKNLSYCYK